MNSPQVASNSSPLALTAIEIQKCIQSGLIRFTDPKKAAIRSRKSNAPNYQRDIRRWAENCRKIREKNIAAGLTGQGKPRKIKPRSVSFKGWTPEQIKEYQRAYNRNYRAMRRGKKI